MQPARVLGTTHATTKHPTLEGRRLVIVQPVLADGNPDASPLIAIDPLGCRRGDPERSSAATRRPRPAGAC
jgi:microcompartment protein CcmK/EutM